MSVTATAAQSAVRCFTGLAEIEDSIAGGLLQSWPELAKKDPFGTLFQGPTWVLHWYRAYSGSFTPLVLALEAAGELTGLVSLAVETRSGRLAFAGDAMADYCDVLSLPEHRETTLREFLRFYRAGAYGNMLRFGSTVPESPSADILMAISREEGIRPIRRTHFGWRWWPEQAREDPFKSRSVKYKLNCLRRVGDVTVELLRGRHEWAAIRDDYYQQHSLRQVYRGTKVSFDNPEKQAFFDSLLDTRLAHVTVLRAGGKMVACHYGCLADGVLYFGAPSFDITYRQYSPGLLLVLFIMKNAAGWGIRGFDLTIGEGDLKERYSTSKVVLPMVELYPRAGTFWRRRAADYAVRCVRGAFRTVRAEDWWLNRVRPSLLETGSRLRAAAGMPGRDGLRYLAEPIAPSKIAAFQASAPALQPPDGGSAAGWDRIYDLLTAPGPPYLAHRVAAAAGRLPEAVHQGSNLHTFLVDGKLAAWGFSRHLKEDYESGIPGLRIPAGAALLHGFDAVPENSAALAQLIRQVAAVRSREGAATLWVLTENPSRHFEEAVSGAGFRRAARSTTIRFLRWKKTWTKPAAEPL